ncbi:hypothetical protein [Massilia aquatica]|uniref:DUF4351 domain-containing protein n=1 Tax=Massilia aquatica TaxID=2609000 RepID=A0ABX0LZS0_9BURK|nr:hypothetical protein [Massilia aquatica]NHZ40378.1 hypothetical protein [Massilia aquatica]
MEGKAEGKAEELIAFRSMLKNILRIKFGEVPPLVLQRIDQSAQAELAGWIERSISAPTLAALFGDDAAPVQAGRT